MCHPNQRMYNNECIFKRSNYGTSSTPLKADVHGAIFAIVHIFVFISPSGEVTWKSLMLVTCGRNLRTGIERGVEVESNVYSVELFRKSQSHKIVFYMCSNEFHINSLAMCA